MLKGAILDLSSWMSRLFMPARDAHGVRPLVLGKLDNGWVFASETAALDIVGASYVREIEPGEFVAVDAEGLRSYRWAQGNTQRVASSSTSTSRAPIATIAGRNVHATGVAVGVQPAKEHPVEADSVIPVPASGTPAAVGYARASGIPAMVARYR
jgi:amidophosphoribosyltransferase